MSIDGQTLAVAVDLGGTSLSCGLVDRAGGLLAQRQQASPAAANSDQLVAGIAAAVSALLADTGLSPRRLAGLGIGAPGLVDAPAGTLRRATNLPGCRDVPLAARLTARFGCPVQVRHDVDLATLAEWRLGAGRGCRHLACICIGTGIGLGLVLNGALYTGAAAGAGNLGHLILSEYAAAEVCRGPGYLESQAAGPAIAAAGGGRDDGDARPVFAAAAAGEPAAARAVARAAHLLGLAAANLANLLDPERIVVGGGVAQAGEALLTPLIATARHHVCAFLAERLTIVPAQLGARAGLIGAGLTVWDPPC
jgi:glucokinase